MAEWQEGMAVGSAHIWHDPDTGEISWVYGSMTVTAVVPVPEPGAASLLVLGLVGLAARRRLAAR